jgi:hypothetical protein
MTLTLELSADLEARLTAEAAEAGMPLTLHVLQMSTYREEWTDEDLADARAASARHLGAALKDVAMKPAIAEGS